MPKTLDEAALRRPEFAGGVEIVLSDGRAWTFALPVIADYYPAMGPDGTPTLLAGYDLGPDYDELIERYTEATGPVEELPILAEIAYILLRRNYAVEFADMRHLLRVKRADDPGRETNAEMWNALGDLAFGRAPKGATSTGSASS